MTKKLTSSYIIFNHGSGFYKPTVPQYPPSHLQHYMFRVSNIISSTCALIHMNFWMKDSLHSGDLNSRPLGRESPALTSRPFVSSNRELQFQYYFKRRWNVKKFVILGADENAWLGKTAKYKSAKPGSRMTLQ